MGPPAMPSRGQAKKPNHNGSFLIEYSPFSRITLTDTVDTLDYHVSGDAMLSTLFIDASSLLGGGSKTNVTVNKHAEHRVRLQPGAQSGGV